MTEDDPLFLWRLAADLSVDDAAILIAGGDPSNPGLVDYARRLAALSGLKAAVKKHQLPAEIFYRMEKYDDANPLSLSEYRLVTKERLDDLFGLRGGNDRPLPSCLGKVCIAEEPDWSATMVKVDDLRAWLRSRGLATGFFFPAEQSEPDAFMDPGHEHFAPELALAVAAWRALASRQKFPGGVKLNVERWIAEHPEAWKDDKPLSAEGLKRIQVLVNWSKGGPT